MEEFRRSDHDEVLSRLTARAESSIPGTIRAQRTDGPLLTLASGGVIEMREARTRRRAGDLVEVE